MRILILGGEGFLGQNILNYLSQTEEHEIYSLGIFQSIFKKSDYNYILTNPYLNNVDIDCEVCIHLIDNHAPLDKYVLCETALAQNLKLKTNSHMIVMSSSVIYANPNCEYAQRKIALENFWHDYCDKNSINLTILRLFNTYGKFHIPFSQGGLIANIFYNYFDNKPIVINDMKIKRDFIFASDVAKLIDMCIREGLTGTFDIASGKMISIKDIIDIISKDVLSDNMNIIDKNLNNDIICPEGNSELCDKIKLTSILDGLVETSEFYKNNYKKIKEFLEEQK